MISQKLESLHLLLDNFCVWDVPVRCASLPSSSLFYVENSSRTEPELFWRPLNDVAQAYNREVLANECMSQNLNINPSEEWSTGVGWRENWKFTVSYVEKRLAKLYKELSFFQDQSMFIVQGKEKAAPRIQTYGISNRRSRYIGVFKNGYNWQTLITVKQKKTYIGTFQSEIYAAKMFDLYSVLTGGFSALTNFDYSVRDTYKMLSEYERHGRLLV